MLWPWRKSERWCRSCLSPFLFLPLPAVTHHKRIYLGFISAHPAHTHPPTHQNVNFRRTGTLPTFPAGSPVPGTQAQRIDEEWLSMYP